MWCCTKRRKCKLDLFLSLKDLPFDLLPSVVLLGPRFIETQFPRSSSGFCERFAGNGGSDPGLAEHSCSAHVVHSASCFLDINSDGDVVTRALADLDLSRSIEVLSGRGGNDDNQRSMTSCDTAELLRTPSTCVVGSDQEAGSGNAGVEARSSREEPVEKNQCDQDQWAALSSIQKEKSREFCMAENGGIQSMTDIPATSTPKKRKANGQNPSADSTEIQEGRYEGSAYHRDGTRVGWYCRYCCSFLQNSTHGVMKKTIFKQYIIVLSRCAVRCVQD